MSFLKGEIKQLVEDSLHWGNKILKSFIKIVKTEEQTSDESNPAENEDDKKRLVADAVFYVLVQEQKRTVHKKGEILKVI